MIIFLFILNLNKAESKSEFGSKKFLFDATKDEMAANADWVIDADSHNLSMPPYGSYESNPQRYPNPNQNYYNSSWNHDTWNGGLSAWAIDLVSQGHQVETLPHSGRITYNDGSNPQDLSNYDVFIVCEPQNLFTSSEKTAILNFVYNGGGLFMIGDHDSSDRNSSGYDSPNIWNDLGSPYYFGIEFNADGISNYGSIDWFNNSAANLVSTDPYDPIIHGPYGDGTGGLGLFGATSLSLNLSGASTDTVKIKAHVFTTGSSSCHQSGLPVFATSEYGYGRVAACGDSSPADDGTGDTNDELHYGWNLASYNVNNDIIFLNASLWLAGWEPETPDPTPTPNPNSFSLANYYIYNKEIDGQFMKLKSSVTINPNGYLIIARDCTKAQFEAHWNVTLNNNVTFIRSTTQDLSGISSFPTINGNEIFQVVDDLGNILDGPTIPTQKNYTYQRKNNDCNSSSSSCWNKTSLSDATPGSGVVTPTGAGLIITEFSDSSNYQYEFIELYYDE